MRKAIAMLPVVSAIYPMITGATAPPTIVMMSREEANLVFVPASLNASENIVGNMILSPRYRAKNAMSDKVPLHTTTINVATKVRMAQASSTSLGWIQFMMTPPASRPIKNRPIPPKARYRLAVCFSI